MVRVWQGKFVDAIQLVYADGTESKKIGGRGGAKVDWQVPRGESIVGLNVKHGWLVDGMQFRTDGGSRSPWFGGAGGNHEKTFNAPHGQSLLGIQGGSGSLIDSIWANWGARRCLTSDPLVSMKLVWSCTGGSKGKHKLCVTRGRKKSSASQFSFQSEFSSKIQSEIKASIGGPIAKLTGNLSTSLKDKVAGAFNSSIEETEERVEALEIDLGRPCYVYQPFVSAPTCAGTFEFFGAPMFRDKPLPVCSGKNRSRDRGDECLIS